MTKEEKCSITQLGRVVIHLDDCEKRVYPDELPTYLSAGWIKGASDKHKKNNRAANTGRPSSNRGGIVSHEHREKIRSTLLSKYKSGEIQVWNKGLTKDKDPRVLNNSIKSTKTKTDKYGSASPTFGKHLSEQHRARLGKSISKARKGKKLSPEKLLIKLSKDYLTRKKNNTFNSSSSEIKLYENLLKEHSNKTIYRQYKDDKRYPFYCDFYIKEDDKFIELNAHWTHGGRPYDPNDQDCQEQLKLWQEKAKTSQFYKNAIYTWTVRDVEKQRIAKENNLNYEVIY